jgi:putative phosphoesterase
MKIVVFSDIHGHKELVERIMLFNPDADYFISLGDTELKLNYLLDLDIIPIRGNYPRDPGLSYEHYMEVNGVKIMLVHGHKYRVNRGLQDLYEKAEEKDCDIALYGHTHILAYDKVNGVILANPGSAHRSRNELSPSYLIIDIEKNKQVQFHYHNVSTNTVMKEK